MDAGETLGSNLLRRLTLSNGLHYFRFRGCQDIRFLLFLLLGDDKLQCSLAEIACVSVNSLQSFTYLTHWTVFEYYAKLVRGIHHTTDELGGELIADENPLRQTEALGYD